MLSLQSKEGSKRIMLETLSTSKEGREMIPIIYSRLFIATGFLFMALSWINNDYWWHCTAGLVLCFIIAAGLQEDELIEGVVKSWRKLFPAKRVTKRIRIRKVKRWG
jgi:hypothetical protein